MFKNEAKGEKNKKFLFPAPTACAAFGAATR